MSEEALPLPLLTRHWPARWAPPQRRRGSFFQHSSPLPRSNVAPAVASTGPITLIKKPLVRGPKPSDVPTSSVRGQRHSSPSEQNVINQQEIVFRFRVVRDRAVRVKLCARGLPPVYGCV